jgi:hypothetical protein
MTADPPYTVNITTTYDSFPNEFDAFVELDSWNQASIWWGAMLLSMWFQGLRAQMAHMQAPDATYDWGDITLTFDPTANIESMDFISYVGTFGMSNGTVHWLSPDEVPFSFKPLSTWNNSQIQPYLPQQIDGFAKAFYSTILVDLGQTNGSNVLNDPKALQYYLAAPFDVNRSTDGVDNYAVNFIGQPPVLASAAYSNLTTSNSTGRLGVKPATIYSEFLCQVPQMKGAGSLIVSIMISDLVFLQTLWTLYCWVAGWWLTKTDSNAMMCQGCLQQQRRNGPYELMRTSDDVRSNVDSTRLLVEQSETLRPRSVMSSSDPKGP